VDDDTGEGSERDSTAGTPRWVKLFGIIALLVMLLFVILMVAGGGRHGPGRHLRSGGTRGQTAPDAGHR